MPGEYYVLTARGGLPDCRSRPLVVRDDVPVINWDASSRALAARRRWRVAQLSDAATQWGKKVPEDPGITELADLLEEVADVLAHPDEPRRTVRAELTAAVEDLRAAARLGGLLPVVTLWHLHRAVQEERAARERLALIV